MRSCLRALSFAAIAAASASAQSYGPPSPDWSQPIAPFRVADNLYYVGTHGLASFLITTPDGDILINSGLVTTPPLIRQSIEQLGFKMSDVKILLISHAHFDHDAGSAEIIKETRAKYMVMDADVPTVQSGGAQDFAYPDDRYPPAHVDRVLHDGDKLTLGGVTLTAHKTAGHTRGCTTWTYQTTLNGKPENVVIVGSWNVNGPTCCSPGFRLADRPGKPASYPGIADDYRRSFVTLAALPCDIFLGAHGDYFRMNAKLARINAGAGEEVWIDHDGYKATVAERQRAFERELQRQQSAAPPS